MGFLFGPCHRFYHGDQPFWVILVGRISGHKLYGQQNQRRTGRRDINGNLPHIVSSSPPRASRC